MYLTEYEFFLRESIVDSITECERAGYTPLFLPEFIDLQLAHPFPWLQRSRSMSICATGRSRQGNRIEIYAHVPGVWTDRAYIADAFDQRKLIGHALPLSNEAILALEERNGEVHDGTRLVTVMEHQAAQNAKFGPQSLDEALENPHVLASFGSEDRTRRYLAACKEKLCSSIFVWHYDDLGDKAVARPLELNYMDLCCGSYFFGGLTHVGGVRHRGPQQIRNIRSLAQKPI